MKQRVGFKYSHDIETLEINLQKMVANHPEYSTTLSFYVNGTAVSVENPRPETTLLMYLRNTLQLTGTKLGCAEGGCGACTVLVSQLDQSTQRIYHYSVNACLGIFHIYQYGYIW